MEFIHMVNANHARALEWDEVYAQAEKSVQDARQHRAEYQRELRKQNRDSLLAGLGCCGMIIVTFVFVGIVVLIF